MAGRVVTPVVRLNSVKRATELKFFLKDPLNFDTLYVVFNRSSRFGRLQNIKCALAGKNLYMRFSCSTGDAVGMSMVSKGVQNVLDFLRTDFPDVDVIGIFEARDIERTMKYQCAPLALAEAPLRI